MLRGATMTILMVAALTAVVSGRPAASPAPAAATSDEAARVALRASSIGPQCWPGGRPFTPYDPEQVCIVEQVENLQLYSIRVTWTDQSLRQNDINIEKDPNACKTGHFNVYGNGWNLDSPTKRFCSAAMSKDVGGHNFDFTDSPRKLKDGELLCGQFFADTPSGPKLWGKPACREQHAD